MLKQTSKKNRHCYKNTEFTKMQFARNWSNIAVRKINYLIKLNPKVKRTAITAFLAIGALLASGSMSAQSFDSELKIEFLTPKTIKWMSDS